jgi:hypothetical protein
MLARALAAIPLNSCKALRAQRNSVARIASPAGITTTAGPGNAVMAMPNNTTVSPVMAMMNLFVWGIRLAGAGARLAA